jgi:signal peptidase I
MTALLIYAGNEPKSVLARDLGDCRDNLRNSRSVFLIVGKSIREEYHAI